MYKKTVVLTLLLVIATCSTSVGYYFGSNGNMSSYPTFYESKPSRPFCFNTTPDKYAEDRYKQDAEEYIKKSKQYINNCNNDIETIQRAKSNVVSDVNQFISEYNSYIRSN